MNILGKFLKVHENEKFNAYRNKNINLSFSRNISPKIMKNKRQAMILPDSANSTTNKLSETLNILGREEN